MPWRVVAYRTNRMHHIARLGAAYWGACTADSGRLAISIFFRRFSPRAIRLLNRSASYERYGQQPFPPDTLDRASDWESPYVLQAGFSSVRRSP